MAKRKSKAAARPRNLVAKSLTLDAKTSDEDVTDLPSQEVMTRVSLTCDDSTGVFFFRHEGRLFMRTVESS